METHPSNGALDVNLNPHYRGRVRSGCLTCRTKKKKCDEQRPNCKRCIQSKRECVYKTKAVQHAAGIPSNRERETSSQHQFRYSSFSPRSNGYTPDLLYLSASQSEPSNRNRPGSHLEECSQILPFSPCDSEIPLPGIQELSQAQERSLTDSGALPLMISQDIHLCTTIDWLAAKECLQTPSFSYFLHKVDLLLVTPFDPFEWARMKSYAVDLASQHRSIAAAISAVQLLFRAQANSLPTTHAFSQYELAKRMFEATLHDNVKDFGTTLVNAFIISLFSTVLLDDTDCILKQSNGAFVESLEAWSLSRQRTPIVSRIAAWLKVMHTAARRGGNQGIMSVKVSDLLSDQCKETPSLSSLMPNNRALIAAHESASALIFRFYLDLQGLSLQIANLCHYHRPRSTGADQEEVVRLMAALKAELYFLWQSRPALMRCNPSEIRAQFSFPTAEPLISLIAISMAAYHTEQVEMGRNLNDPQTPEAQEAMRRIRDLVEGDWNAPCKGKHNPAYLRPLFIYAIESLDPEGAHWAVDRMKEIKDPICRSDFFASYAQGLAEAQRIKERRVTARWFCYQNYNVRPPFL
jgi:hypothetical protein